MAENFIPLDGSAGNAAPVAGGRRRKLKLVTKKAARKALRKVGLKMKGGDGAVVADAKTNLPAVTGGGEPTVVEADGGRRRSRRGGKKTKRRSASRRASIFGL